MFGNLKKYYQSFGRNPGRITEKIPGKISKRIPWNIFEYTAITIKKILEGVSAKNLEVIRWGVSDELPGEIPGETPRETIGGVLLGSWI